MSEWASIIINYLDEDGKSRLAKSLSENIESEKNLETLCLVSQSLKEPTLDQIYPDLISFFEKTLFDSNNYNDLEDKKLVNLVDSFKGLETLLKQEAEVHIYSYISSHSFCISQDAQRIVNQIVPRSDYKLAKDESEPGNVDSLLIRMLSLLENLWRKDTAQILEFSKLDHMILLLLIVGSEKVSEKALKTIKWRMNEIINGSVPSRLVWETIFTLVKAPEKFRRSQGYIIWLRYLMSSKSNAVFNSEFFQDNILRDTQYWIKIQEGIRGDSHEIRKYCIEILHSTINNVKRSFSNDVFYWKVEDDRKLKKEWERYITILSVIAIDTSLHQAEAGIEIIIGLFSPDSLISTSWGVCLLSTGFTATMDSVRKFSLSLLFSIPKDGLSLFKHGLWNLENIFLPYAMIASHFSVRQGTDARKLICPYGVQLRTFISSIVSAASDEEYMSDLAYVILRLTEKMKDSFEPARIYVLLGLLDGLGERNILDTSSHGKLLINLFEANCEIELYELTAQTINIRLLTHFKINSVIDVLHLLCMFLRFNGISLMRSNIKLIKNYLQRNGITYESLIESSEIAENTDMKAIGLNLALCLCESREVDKITELCDSSRELALKLAVHNLTEALYSSASFIRILANTVTEVINGSYPELMAVISTLDARYLEKFSTLDIDITALWNSIQNGIQSNKIEEFNGACYKIKFLVTLLNNDKNRFVAKTEILNLGSLLQFYGTIFEHMKELLLVDRSVYKVREEILSFYYRLLFWSITNNPHPDYRAIIDILDLECANMDTNMMIIEIVELLMEKDTSHEYIPNLLLCLTRLWESIESRRLQLNQKDLHIRLISTLCKPHVLQFCPRLEDVSSSLKRFCLSVVSHSETRRCFLPTLTRCMITLQRCDRTTFESISWIPEILTKSYIIVQLSTNAFRLVKVIADLFDQCLSLDSSTDIYKEIYGSDEVSSKVKLLAIFGSIETSMFANRMFTYIMENKEEFNLFNIIKNTDGVEEKRRLDIFAIILSLVHKLDARIIRENYFDKFVNQLAIEPSPLVRVFIEWFISFFISKDIELMKKMMKNLDKLLKSPDSKPTLVADYERFVFLAIQKYSVTQEADLLQQFIVTILPAATSNKAIIRHFTVSLIFSIHLEVKRKELELESSLTQIVANVYDTISKSQIVAHYRSGDALMWDIYEDLTMVSLSGAILLKLSDRQVSYLTRDMIMENLSHEEVYFLKTQIGYDNEEHWIKNRIIQQQKSLISLDLHAKGGNSPLQMKNTAWNSIIDTEDVSKASNIKRSDLIVVASLVDKAPNLGGICRLCDVLGVGTLTLHDINISKHPQFRTVAVTADQWVPMIELKPEDITAYFQAKKREGYTLIGLEQTDKSVVLNSDLKFPKKSLILLGKEKEGIPGDLLSELDFCVEINQVGVVRSMNIQTATAVIVHAYSAQYN